jgi:hypothetical protein
MAEPAKLAEALVSRICPCGLGGLSLTHTGHGLQMALRAKKGERAECSWLGSSVAAPFPFRARTIGLQ